MNPTINPNHLTRKPILFRIGQVFCTPGANQVLRGIQPGRELITIHELLARHCTGDYGDLSLEDRLTNEAAIAAGGRILSSYKAPDGVTPVWCITDEDRSQTTFLLPSEA